MLLAVCFLVQCDSMTEEDDMSLTKAETEDLVYSFMENILFSDPALEEKEVHSRSDSTGRSDITFECPRGGEIRTTGTFSESETALTFSSSASGNFIPKSCEFDGFVLTSNSIQISLAIAVDLTEQVPQFDFVGSFDGTVEWEYRDRSGTCRWALDLESILRSDALEVYLVGDACDYEIDLDITDLFE